MRNLTRRQKSALASQSSSSHAPKQVSLKRHRLRCEICRHDLCQQIEEAFLQWRSPKVIMHCFRIKTETSIYHHAHAFRLFDLRNQGLRYALGSIIEDADTLPITAQDVLRAIHALAHINNQGQWVHPTNKSEVVVSAKRMPAAPSRSPTYESGASCTSNQTSPLRHPQFNSRILLRLFPHHSPLIPRQRLFQSLAKQN
jgi:hypothetical protein